MNNITKHEPTLPGLLPDAEAARLVDELVTFWPEDTTATVELRRAITVTDKRKLEKRLRELQSLLRPLSEASEERKRAATAIAQMFTGFPSMRNADGEGLTAAYLAILEDQPIFAVVAACKDVAQGKIPDLDTDWAPSSGRLHEQARKHAADPLMELVRIRKTLKGEPSRRPTDPATQKKIGEGLKQQASAMVAEQNEKIDSDRKRMREEMAARSRYRNERAMLAEYHRLGVEPRYAGDGVLISPSLLQSLQGKSY